MLKTEQPEVLIADKKSNPLKMSYEEFLAWSDEDVHAEWVNGEVLIQMPPKYIHQAIIAFLDRLLGLFVAFFDLGEVLTAPFEMKLIPDSSLRDSSLHEPSSREPDILFVAKENLARLTEDKLLGPADLVIEIVSKSSVKIDQEDKLEEYRKAGVREYWIIDNRPQHRWVQFYQLDANGQYQVIPIEEGVYHSAVLPGFRLQVEWLWAENPDIWQALAQVIGPEQIVEALRKREARE